MNKSNIVLTLVATVGITSTQYVDVISGTANLPYSVEYFADGTATAGNVTSNVVYFIQYK